MICNDYGNVCNFCTICIVLFVMFLIIIIGIGSAFIYFHWCLKRSNTNINPDTETIIY